MKNISNPKSSKSNLRVKVSFFLFIGFFPILFYSQNYRTIGAYIEDFGKNEMFIKKALMDYTITIVESQLDSRSKTTASRIVDKINDINNVLKRADQGFEGNTLLRDSFIKMNELTIDALTNGSLILNDYDYQSSLSFPEIGENLNKKEASMIAYYKGLQNYELDKRTFGLSFKLHFKKPVGKNILEYNAFQNILFYKLNVIDEKLTKVVTAVDKKGFDVCMNLIAVMHLDIMTKTTAYRNLFKDTTLNQVNIEYANLINNQQIQLSYLFTAYSIAFESLQELKKSSNAEAPDTVESITVYNDAVKDYNAKKNLFYTLFNDVQKTKGAMYDYWLIVNATFIKNNGEFGNLHDKFVLQD